MMDMQNRLLEHIASAFENHNNLTKEHELILDHMNKCPDQEWKHMEIQLEFAYSTWNKINFFSCRY